MLGLLFTYQLIDSHLVVVDIIIVNLVRRTHVYNGIIFITDKAPVGAQQHLARSRLKHLLQVSFLLYFGVRDVYTSCK